MCAAWPLPLPFACRVRKALSRQTSPHALFKALGFQNLLRGRRSKERDQRPCSFRVIDAGNNARGELGVALNFSR